jgi:rubrerythrin
MDFYNGDSLDLSAFSANSQMSFNPNMQGSAGMSANMPVMNMPSYIPPQQGFMMQQPAAPLQPAVNSDDPPAASPMSPEMQEFMAQGYLMGPNCFGKDAQNYTNQIMAYINDEYRDSLYYSTLTRRSTAGNARRIFRNIASDEMKHAHRWAAAYFLVTGKRYFPTRGTVEPVIVPPNYNTALRDRYIAESRDAVKYRQFADATSDRCLKRMAIDTSDDERQHAQEILSIIQNM